MLGGTHATSGRSKRSISTRTAGRRASCCCAQIADWGEVELIERGIHVHARGGHADRVMERLGVPRDAITILDRSRQHRRGSRPAAAARARANSWRSVIIVTSKQHTRRARLVMRRRLAGTGMKVIMRASPLRPHRMSSTGGATARRCASRCSKRSGCSAIGSAWRTELDMIGDGSERGPVALPVFKIGRCLLAGQAGFDSQALPPFATARMAKRLASHRLRFRLPKSARLTINQQSTASVSDRSGSTSSAPASRN